MNNLTINEQELSIKEYKGQRVVTFDDIDKVHGRPQGTASRNFRTNKEYFVENEDYFDVTTDKIKSDEIRRARFFNNPRGGYLITETGYLMLVKSFTDKLAWEVQRKLVAGYFRAKENSTPTLTRKTYMGKTVMTIRDLQDLSGANNSLINHCVKMSGDDWRLLEYQRMINFNEQNNNQYPQVQSIIIFGLATALKVADMLGFTDSQIKAIFRYFEKPVQQNIHLLSDKEQQKAKPVTLQEIDIATKILAIMPDSQFKENACHTLLYDVLGQPFFRKVDFLDTIQAMAKELGGMTKDEITASINSNVTQDVINSLSDRGKFLFQRQLNISSSR